LLKKGSLYISAIALLLGGCQFNRLDHRGGYIPLDEMKGELATSFPTLQGAPDKAKAAHTNISSETPKQPPTSIKNDPLDKSDSEPNDIKQIDYFASSPEDDFLARLPIRKVYRANWSGIHIGDMVLDISYSPGSKDIIIANVHIRSRKIAHLISKYRSDNRSVFRVNDDDKLVPLTYSSAFELRSKRRDVSIIYNTDNGSVKRRASIPPEVRTKRKEVPQELLSNVYDPILLGFVARDQIIKALQGNDKQFTLPLFDGRRRSDFEFTINGITKSTRLLHISVSEIAVAGYTNNELKKMKERKAVIHLYLSTKDLLPVRALGKSLVGDATAYYDHDCKTVKDCLVD